MFSALGLFKSVECPRRYDCGLPSCIFSHAVPRAASEARDAIISTQEYDPFSAGEVHSPPTKRRRLDSPGLRQAVEKPVDAEATRNVIDRPRTLSGETHATVPDDIHAKESIKPRIDPLQARHTSTIKQPPASVTRTVSPPPKKDDRTTVHKEAKQRLSKTESLTPRQVPNAPAVLKTRLALLQKLHEHMKLQNSRLAALKDGRESLSLSDQEVITFSLDEEEAATNLGENIYKNALAQKVLRIKKMTTDEWVKMIGEWTGADSQKPSQVKEQDGPAIAISNGLSTIDEQIAILKHLHTPLEGLEQFGYVTSKPTETEIAKAKAGTAAAGGFETCDRCSTRFQVFLGRDQHGRLTSNGKCRYHWAKPFRTGGSKATRVVGQSEAVYTCCNKSQGSEGCSEASTHVFNVKDPKRLASILQFEHTPTKSDFQRRRPVSFDCEMGYTTLGMEVIRLTAVVWPTNKLLLDILVRPYGEILDLNTRFSGVTPHDFAAAPSYHPASVDGVIASTEGKEHVLRRVDSPAAARALLFKHLSQETPLIGHSIENDLNVCRVIHPFVIDTVLLYPHPRGLPFRYGLRILSQKYLSRSIQTAGEAGHDSKEDAVATGDLVTNKVAEKWGNMRRQGWSFVNGMLTAPDETDQIKDGM